MSNTYNPIMSATQARMGGSILDIIGMYRYPNNHPECKTIDGIHRIDNKAWKKVSAKIRKIERIKPSQEIQSLLELKPSENDEPQHGFSSPLSMQAQNEYYFFIHNVFLNECGDNETRKLIPVFVFFSA